MIADKAVAFVSELGERGGHMNELVVRKSRKTAFASLERKWLHRGQSMTTTSSPVAHALRSSRETPEKDAAMTEF